jgi:hypothetical protein
MYEDTCMDDIKLMYVKSNNKNFRARMWCIYLGIICSRLWQSMSSNPTETPMQASLIICAREQRMAQAPGQTRPCIVLLVPERMQAAMHISRQSSLTSSASMQLDPSGIPPLPRAVPAGH